MKRPRSISSNSEIIARLYSYGFHVWYGHVDRQIHLFVGITCVTLSSTKSVIYVAPVRGGWVLQTHFNFLTLLLSLPCFLQALDKMQQEWRGIEFTFVEYKDTGISILSAVDDLQVRGLQSQFYPSTVYTRLSAAYESKNISRDSAAPRKSAAFIRFTTMRSMTCKTCLFQS